MNPLEDDIAGAQRILDDAIRGAKSRTNVTDKPLPQIRGKRINGVLYVRAEDIADALASQAPGPNKRLIAKLRGSA